jgi:hypothetical protein
MKFAEALAHDRRLAVLRLLIEADGHANESVLQSGLDMLGHSAGLTRQVMRADLKFLEDCGCIRQEWFGDKVVVAHIQRRGVEVAEGRTRVDGIKRPALGE